MGCLSMRTRGGGGRSPPPPPLAVFTQELLRRHEERILLENAADDNHRMGPHDVNHRVTAKFSKLVGADDRVVVTLPHIIDNAIRTQPGHRCTIGLRPPSPSGNKSG